MTEDVLALAEILWDYHHMHHVLEPADVILVLCSHDVVVADRGADVFLAGYAPLLVVSGGSGAITRRIWAEPEAEVFARRAIARGVPPDRVLRETRSTNTGENVRFTRELLTARGVDPARFIVVQKPYMERRAYATFRQVWPEKHVQVTSPPLDMREYLARYSSETLSAEDVVSIMVGDLQRIRLYPSRGFQVAQEIPDHVWTAYEALVARGFDRHLVA
jgi:uncharacterized SAM-binding protein YcdF (DUF218 family)